MTGRAKSATYWGPAMSASQFAVYQFDVKMMVMREGEPLVFDSLAEAERYSQDKVVAEPRTGCRIFDSGGKTVGTFADASVYEKFHGQPAAMRSIWIGLANLLVGLILIGIDVWFGLRLILPFLIGFRFVWVAAVKLIDGVASLKREQNKK